MSVTITTVKHIYPNIDENMIKVENGKITFWGAPELQPTDNELLEAYLTCGGNLLEDLQKEAIAKILVILSEFPGRVFKCSAEKLKIYERKQALVSTWKGEGFPLKVQIEWNNDWALRKELGEQGWVSVDALGMSFKCRTVEDLWGTWKLNTALADYLDYMSEPLRTKSQVEINSALTEDEVNSVLTKFTKDLYALPITFSETIAPGLILKSGLEVSKSGEG